MINVENCKHFIILDKDTYSEYLKKTLDLNFIVSAYQGDADFNGLKIKFMGIYHNPDFLNSEDVWVFIKN